MSPTQHIAEINQHTQCGIKNPVCQAFVQCEICMEAGEVCYGEFVDWNFPEDPDDVILSVEISWMSIETEYTLCSSSDMIEGLPD